MSPSPATVLVTGATGYIAGWIIKYLLEDGHTVHATVRNPGNSESIAHLEKIAEKAPGTLVMFKADLLDPDSFDVPMGGCDVVIHTASPFIMEGYKDAYETLVRPAVEGTRSVLKAANRTPSVKRVVLTSSGAAVYGDNVDLAKNGKPAFSEDDWNTSSSVAHNPYQFSKVQAEKEAWIIAKGQSQWRMVTINPVMVFGPSLTTSSKSASIDTLCQLGDGRLRPGVPKLSFGVVDVREVARAHLLAAFDEAASGRYLLVNQPISLMEMSDILREAFGPSYPFPARQIPKFIVWLIGPLLGPVTRKFISRNVGHKIAFDNSHSKGLGVHYRPVKETLVEHFQQLLDDGQVKKQ